MGFRQNFLEKFVHLAACRIQSYDADKRTPLQAEFLKPESGLRKMLLKMVDFDAANREEYLRSGALLQDVETLAVADVLGATPLCASKEGEEPTNLNSPSEGKHENINCDVQSLANLARMLATRVVQQLKQSYTFV